MATTPLDSICGVWIDKDAVDGEKISAFIRKELGRTVVRADVKNSSFIQDAPNYVGYFAVITSKALKSKNHEFMVYLTSVLWRMYNLNFNSNIVLVIVDKKKRSNDHQEKSLKTEESESVKLPINLRILPRVDAGPDVDDDCLHEIASKFQGPSLFAKDSLPIGNVGIGLAWSYFYGYLALILPGMVDRIEKSDVYRKNSEKMSSFFIILVPESCRTPAKFSDVDARFTTIGPLDEGITKARAGQPERPYKNFVHQIKKNQEDYYFCGEFATPILALRKMLESEELGEMEVNKQVVLFTHTLRTILQSHPLCQNKAVVASYADDIPEFSLADELCTLILEPIEFLVEINERDRDNDSKDHSPTTLATSPSSSFQSTLDTIGSAVDIGALDIVHGADGEMLAESLEKFCAVAQPTDEDIESGILDFSVTRHSSFENLRPELVDPSNIDLDEGTGGKTAKDKLLIILTEDFKDEVENIADKLIKHTVWFPRTTVIVDLGCNVPVPEWLEKNGADYIETSKVDLWKRVFGSLFGVASVEGEEDKRWQNCAGGKQKQKQRLPVANVAEGLAWAYYHNYLTIIGPKMAERIRETKHYSDKKMASKFFILLPHSCYSYPKLEDADSQNIESPGDAQLKPLVVNIAGNNRNYNTFIHRISVGQETYFACVEYCTPVLVMYEMEAEGLSGLSPARKAAELRVFYEVLKKILNLPTAPDWCRNIVLLKYDDTSFPKVKLSELLVKEIKRSL